MRSKIFTFLMGVFSLLFLINISYAQEQEIVPIPQEWEGSEFGVINRFIHNDTTETGERKHPNCIYQLERGGYYDVNSPLSIDYDITIAAAPDDPNTDADDAPPMISRGTDGQGNYISGLFVLRGDNSNLTFEGILFNGAQDDNQIVNRGSSLFGSISGINHRVVFDNCIFSGWGGNLLNSRDCDGSTWIFTNNIFRNGVDLDNPWGGNIYSVTTTAAHQDTIKFINNTFFNYSSYQFLSWDFVDYIEYDHNTLFVSTLNAHWAPYLTNAKFTNNIFFNYQTVGQTTYEIENGHWDKDGISGNQPSSICKVALVDPQRLFDNGLTEADRMVNYSNNVYYWTNELKTYWSTHKDSSQGVELDILPITFMNDHSDSMFKSLGDYDYPNFIAKDNVELDPGFNATLVTDVMAKEMPFVKNYRRYGVGALVDPKERFYAPDGFYWDLLWTWPLPEDLTYTNSDVLTHADGGFPAGDLNWYPDKKAQWEEWVTSVENNENRMGPNEYTLSQNYPNPFNPTTEISFSIPVSGKTILIVYNVLGQKVVTILDKNLAAGTYKYKFDASDFSSGLYFYKLQSKNYTQVKKMMLVK